MLLIGGGLVLMVALSFMGSDRTSLRPGEQKTVRVVLPPPPPPPEIKPQEKPPEPKPTPIEQPTDSPPPPTPQSEPTPGDSALTAREGAGPSNYGLAGGDGRSEGRRVGEECVTPVRDRWAPDH